MDIAVKIYSLGEIRSGVSARTNEPWASREVVLTILDHEKNMEETKEKMVVNFLSPYKQQLDELKLDDKMAVKVRFHAFLYDRTKRWCNSISVSMAEAKRIY